MKNQRTTTAATDVTTELSVLSLVPGQLAQSNDGGFYRVVVVDPILDPRGGVYEGETAEALVRFDRGDTCEFEIVRGMVRVRAA
jgi:hypothetical protein